MSDHGLALIRQKFLTKLSSCQPDFAQFTERLTAAPPTPEALAQIRTAIHQIAGSAKTFGFAHTSEYAATVEALIDRLLNDTRTTRVNQALVVTKLHQAFEALNTHIAELVQSHQSENSVQAASETLPVHASARYKVLVADDDELVVELLRNNLEARGCEVIEVANGKDVMIEAKLHAPHLIIQDVNMPGLNGFEVLKALKASAATCDIPVMMLTKRAEDRSVIEGISSGAADYMIKPFDIDTLVARVLGVLKKADTKILIADDDEIVCHLLTLRLRKLGYRVSVAHSGPETLAKFKTETFNLILLDIMMPGIDGMAILREIKLHMRSDTPVVMLTAKNQSENIVKSFDAGAHDYIVKPFDLDELVARVTAILRRQ